MANANATLNVLDLIRPPVEGYGSNSILHAIEAKNFELKPAIIHVIQLQARFGGTAVEDPYAHMERFLSICDTFKFNGVTADAVILCLFPFSLQRDATEWLTQFPVMSITMELVQVFLNKYFPPTKIAQLFSDIIYFKQKDGESLNSAWTRFKKKLRMCPQHNLTQSQQTQTFYNGADSSVWSMLDATANGSLFIKTPADSWEIIGNMVEINVGWPDLRKEKKAGVLEVGALTAFNANIDALTHQMSLMQSAPINQVQGIVVEGQQNFEGEAANFVGNQGRQSYNPYSNTYNPGWKNHPNFSWKSPKDTANAS
ncbi:uncharacterized protein [Henckelia pumila]|uniref:uncharacterized protein n=1 Tax=Henckelia pumila TaxID=405737 RepID=UPI003C6E32C6